MKFLVLTRTPPQRTLLGVTNEHWAVTDVEADDLEQLKRRIEIPLLGECKIISQEHVTTIKSKIVNEEV